MLLAGRHILVMGVMNTQSAAWHIGQAILSHGGRVTYTIQRNAILRLLKKELGDDFSNYTFLPCNVSTPKLDFTAPNTEIEYLADSIDAIDGLVHCIGYAPSECLTTEVSESPKDQIIHTLDVSALSLKYVYDAIYSRNKFSNSFTESVSVVALTFDSSRVYPGYGWMSPTKVYLEGMSRILAAEGGPHNIRFNCIEAGPMDTMAASHIPRFSEMPALWDQQAPLGWDYKEDVRAVADMAVLLLSDMTRKTTGQVIRVDGGRSIMGV